MKPAKLRLDRLLVERGLAETREKAQALILAGQVLVDEQKVEHCGAGVRQESSLRLLGPPAKYVSRAGLKLEGALDQFRVDPRGKTCLDIGSSTGGFTQCLLERGAQRVIAVDVEAGLTARVDPELIECSLELQPGPAHVFCRRTE